MDNRNRVQYLQKLQIYGHKKNPKREQQLRVSKRKYPYKQMRKEEREGAIPVKIANLREEGKKKFFLEKREQQLRVKERQYPYKQISSSGKIKFQRGGRWKIQEGDEIWGKMQVVRDFGNFVNRARRSFGENTGSGGFWDFC